MGEREYYTLDQLAAAAGMTARNVRAYQTRGLLPSPVRDGRSALYDAEHLSRLIEVRRLREAGVPLRLILRSVGRGEDLGDGGPLHSLTRSRGQDLTAHGGEPAVAPARLVNAEVLNRAERAAPGILDLLHRLRLLLTDERGTLTCPPMAELLVRLPAIASTHPQLLEVIAESARLSDSVRAQIEPAPGSTTVAKPDLHELAHVAAVVVRACLTRPD